MLVTNRNYYSMRWDHLNLNQTCFSGTGDANGFLAATTTPGQSLQVASQGKKDWTLAWDVEAKDRMSTLCIETGEINCRTKGTVRAKYWNTHYNVDVDYTKRTYCLND
jgi:hypothetical protein